MQNKLGKNSIINLSRIMISDLNETERHERYVKINDK